MVTEPMGTDDAVRAVLARIPHFYGVDLAISALADLFAATSPREQEDGRPYWLIPMQHFVARLETFEFNAMLQLDWLKCLACDGVPILDYTLRYWNDPYELFVHPGEGIDPRRWIEAVLRSVPTIPEVGGGDERDEWFAIRNLPGPSFNDDDWVRVDMTLAANRIGQWTAEAVERALATVALTRTDDRPTLHLRRVDSRLLNRVTGQGRVERRDYFVLRRNVHVIDQLGDYVRSANEVDPELLDACVRYLTRKIEKEDFE